MRECSHCSQGRTRLPRKPGLSGADQHLRVDHSCISEYRRRNLNLVEGLFIQILSLCKKARMVSLNHEITPSRVGSASMHAAAASQFPAYMTLMRATYFDTEPNTRDPACSTLWAPKPWRKNSAAPLRGVTSTAERSGRYRRVLPP